MISRSAWLHLRIPFSYYLIPVFLWAISQSPDPIDWKTAAVFFILHLFVYPASNGYNSYFDKDEESIGGLEKPPPVDKGLYWISLVFELVGIILALAVGTAFGTMVLIYGIVSKAYSHPSVRLKRYGVTALLTVAVFQGAFTVFMVLKGVSGISTNEMMEGRYLQAAILSSAMLFGTYPMTQVYQHREDARRGDFTLSLMLGIKGTFIFTMLVFSIALAGFTWYFAHWYSLQTVMVFHGALLPVLVFFLYWFRLVFRDVRLADYTNTMRLNFLSATCLSGFFLWLTFFV